jgi:RimJ/RimL family protein N-acetyltransferase
VPPLPLSKIVTERLELWPLAMSDVDEMVAVLADEALYEFTGGEAPTREALQQRYHRQLAGPTNQGEYWLNWITRTKADQHAVGFTQATVVGRSADVAWLVGIKDQGLGIATEAAHAVGSWLASIGIEHLRAHIHPLHAGSQAVATRLGMHRTGELDQEGEEIWTRTFDLEVLRLQIDSQSSSDYGPGSSRGTGAEHP